VKGKGKVVAKGKTTVEGGDGDGDDYDRGDDDDDGDFEGGPSFKDAQDLSALYMVQQALTFHVFQDPY